MSEMLLERTAALQGDNPDLLGPLSIDDLRLLPKRPGSDEETNLREQRGIYLPEGTTFDRTLEGIALRELMPGYDLPPDVHVHDMPKFFSRLFAAYRCHSPVAEIGQGTTDTRIALIAAELQGVVLPNEKVEFVRQICGATLDPRYLYGRSVAAARSFTETLRESPHHGSVRIYDQLLRHIAAGRERMGPLLLYSVGVAVEIQELPDSPKVNMAEVEHIGKVGLQDSVEQLVIPVEKPVAPAPSRSPIVRRPIIWLGPILETPLADKSWRDDALCAQTDPEIFFPEQGGTNAEAKRVCVVCDVRSECLEYALEHHERFGIWGGLSEHERRKIKRG